MGVSDEDCEGFEEEEKIVKKEGGHSHPYRSKSHARILATKNMLHATKATAS